VLSDRFGLVLTPSPTLAFGRLFLKCEGVKPVRFSQTSLKDGQGIETGFEANGGNRVLWESFIHHNISFAASMRSH
jgi:hypothetical protein